MERRAEMCEEIKFSAYLFFFFVSRLSEYLFNFSGDGTVQKKDFY